MKNVVLTIYMVAFALQLLGTGGVIQDVRQGLRNARKLRTDLAAAQQAALDHRRAIEQGPPIVTELGRRLGKDTDRIIRQLGPSSAKEREAVVNYATAQNNISDLRRWGAVALLVIGVVLGFAGNALSLYIPSH